MKTTKHSLTTKPAIVGNNLLSAGLSSLKGYYIIGNRTGCCQTETISFQRRNAIYKFIKDTSMTWKELQKYGWIVYKVDIVFQPCR